MAEQKKLALSFSGGGARAFCYFGVIRCLESNGIRIDYLQGFSGGAIVICFLAAGLSDEETIKEFSKFRFYKFYSLRPLKNGGFLDIKKTIKYLNKYTKGKDIKDLPYKTLIYTSEISDFDHPVQVKYTSGDLAKYTAISCIVPPFWPLHNESGKKFADGGYTTLYATQPLRDEGAEVVIGCNVNGAKYTKVPHFISGMVSTVESLITQIDNFERAKYPPDLELLDFESNAGLYDFSKAREMYEAGWKEAERNLPAIKRLLGL